MSDYDDEIVCRMDFRAMRSTSIRVALSRAHTREAIDEIICDLLKVSAADAAAIYAADAALTTASAVANFASIKACDLGEDDPQSRSVKGMPIWTTSRLKQTSPLPLRSSSKSSAAGAETTSRVGFEETLS